MRTWHTRAGGAGTFGCSAACVGAAGQASVPLGSSYAVFVGLVGGILAFVQPAPEIDAKNPDRGAWLHA